MEFNSAFICARGLTLRVVDDLIETAAISHRDFLEKWRLQGRRVFDGWEFYIRNQKQIAARREELRWNKTMGKP